MSKLIKEVVKNKKYDLHGGILKIWNLMSHTAWICEKLLDGGLWISSRLVIWAQWLSIHDNQGSECWTKKWINQTRKANQVTQRKLEVRKKVEFCVQNTYSYNINKCGFPGKLQAYKSQFHLFLPKEALEPIQYSIYYCKHFFSFFLIKLKMNFYFWGLFYGPTMFFTQILD